MRESVRFRGVSTWALREGLGEEWRRIGDNKSRIDLEKGEATGVEKVCLRSGVDNRS